MLKLHNNQESRNILKEHIKLVLHFYVSQFLFICYKQSALNSGLLNRNKKACYFHGTGRFTARAQWAHGRSSQCCVSGSILWDQRQVSVPARSNTVTRLVKALSSAVQGQHAPCYQRNVTATEILCRDSSEAVLIHLRNATWRKKKTPTKPTTMSLAKMFNTEEPWQENQQREERILNKNTNWHISTLH